MDKSAGFQLYQVILIMFKPATAVVYDIRVFVRNGKGKTESKPLQLTVTK